MNLEKFFSEDNTTNDKTTKPDSNTKNDVELVEEDNGQFSLFGGVTEKGQKKKTNSKTTSTKNKASKNSKQKSTVNLKITGEWTIHYATHTFNVTDFISIPDGEHVSPEDIRKEMEKEFFEMTKSRTKWDYDEENKRLFPDVIGTSKGCF